MGFGVVHVFIDDIQEVVCTELLRYRWCRFLQTKLATISLIDCLYRHQAFNYALTGLLSVHFSLITPA